MKLNFNDIPVEISSNGKRYTLTVEGQTLAVEVLHAGEGRLELLIDGKRVTAYVSADQAQHWVTIHGRTYLLTKASGGRKGGPGHHHAAGELTAPMPGQVRAVNVSEGEPVKKGQTLLVLEAMKMEIRIHAPQDGVVGKLFVRQGETVEREQKLVDLHEPGVSELSG